jgi:hypothetical protein
MAFCSSLASRSDPFSWSEQMSQQTILNSIINELAEQDLKRGGPIQDDLHSRKDWADLLQVQISKTRDAHPASPVKDYRERLIKIAALAIAALESEERLYESLANHA